MAAIRGRDTSPELTVRRYRHGRGLRYRLHVAYFSRVNTRSPCGRLRVIWPFSKLNSMVTPLVI